jgi:hypothetical protein
MVVHKVHMVMVCTMFTKNVEMRMVTGRRQTDAMLMAGWLLKGQARQGMIARPQPGAMLLMTIRHQLDDPHRPTT